MGVGGHGALYLNGSKGEDAKDLASLGVNVEVVGEIDS